jgi:hypothetical protein
MPQKQAKLLAKASIHANKANWMTALYGPFHPGAQIARALAKRYNRIFKAREPQGPTEFAAFIRFTDQRKLMARDAKRAAESRFKTWVKKQKPADELKKAA